MKMSKQEISPELQQLLDAQATAQKKEVEDERKLGNIRERLMQRARRYTVQVPIVDAEGIMNIRCRIFTQKEQNKIFKLLTNVSQIKVPVETKDSQKSVTQTYEKLLDQIFEMLAYPKGACLSPTFDMGFWKEGEYTTDLPFFILQYVLGESNKIVKQSMTEAELFRKK